MRLGRKPVSPSRRQRLAPEEPPQRFTFSYTASARQGRPERLNRQDLAKQAELSARLPLPIWLRRAAALILAVLMIVIAVDLLSLSPSAKIVPLDQTGSQSYLQPNRVYAAAAESMLKGSIWNRTKVTLDTSAIRQQMLKKFPELTSVSVTVPLLSHHPSIYIQAASPALILNTADGTFVISTAGKALTQLASSAAGPAGLPYVIDRSGLHIRVRQQALPAKDVQFIETITAELAARQYNVTNLILPPASREVDASLAGQPFYVKFNLQDSDPAGEAGTFLASIAGLKKQNITPVQYVDVRVPGRAYYK